MLTKQKQNRKQSFAGELLVLGCFVGIASYGKVQEGSRIGNAGDYCLLWLVCMILGAVATPKSKQSISAAVGILLIPFAIDCLNAYDSDAAVLALILCLGAVAGYSLVVLFFWLRHRKPVGKKKLRRFQNFLFRCRQLTSFICTSALIILMVGYSIAAWQESRNPPVSQQQGEIALKTVGDNRELIHQFRDRTWKQLAQEQRIALLQKVADVECDYLGIPFSLNVSCREIADPALRAYYAHARYEVCLNQDLIEDGSAAEALSTLFHEVFHAYEYAVVEAHGSTDPAYQNLRLYENAWVYEMEFEHYISGSEDPDAYSKQAVEEHSNAYAQTRLQEYQEMIAYLNGQ